MVIIAFIVRGRGRGLRQDWHIGDCLWVRRGAARPDEVVGKVQREIGQIAVRVE
jgi:hypothetical protein